MMESRMDKIQRLGQEADAVLKAQAAEAERAAVVKWLREKVTRTRLVGLLERVDHLADAIEAREHLKSE